ncbi:MULTISPECIES: DMT family transporter [Halorussus]|uniref:DMT family transporter n=1 Tax=Halorussus TaxID=1070314 RepID=UPI00209D76FC|nr:DMT family transporter [Halorussus vallis]USZ78039.1 DMT family transporter [Halorussus vallis]
MVDMRTSLPAIPSGSARTRAVREALFVTLLWSSSYVLVTVGLEDIPALTFAGLRYGLASLVLLPFFVGDGHHRRVRRAGPAAWARLLALGVVLYAVTQGAQFVALGHLRAATVSLVLTFTPVAVALFGAARFAPRARREPREGERGERQPRRVAEQPTARQWVGLVALVGGALAYFRPWAGPLGSAFGLGVMAVGLLGNAGGSVLGRRVNRDSDLGPLAVTTVSMGVGAAVLLAAGVASQGFPTLSLENWAVVAWLAVVNTAGAFTLWNRTLETLTAVESSVVNNTMLVQVAALGWLFLGEAIRPHELLGVLAVGGGGVLLVQLGRAKR